MRMWAITRDTQGCGCGFSDPVAEELCKRPELRSLRPYELAQALGVAVSKAQRGINKVAAIVGKSDSIPQGVSVDECFADLGQSAPSQILFAPDAGGIFGPQGLDAGDTTGAVGQPLPWGLFAVFVGAAVLVYSNRKRR